MWAELKGLYGWDEGILKYANNGDFETIISVDGYNRLRGLSYELVRYWRSYKRFAKLVPFLKSVEDVSNEVVNKLRFHGALLVLGVPRSGKSTGSEWGVMRWIVEKDVTNYVVIIIAPNRRLAVQLYKNAAGFWVKMLNDLSYNTPENAMTLARKVKVVLYLGGELSCLRNLGKHAMSDCLRCPLFRKYDRYWRKFPTIPLADPIMLMRAGYCPFRALFSRNFIHNSIIITTYSSLPIILKAVEHAGVKKIILMVDEWLEYLYRKRIKIKRISEDRFEDEEIKQLIREYNRLIDELKKYIIEYYNRLYGESASWQQLGNKIIYLHDTMDKAAYSKVEEIFDAMKSVLDKMRERAKELDVDERLRVLRLVGRLEAKFTGKLFYYDRSKEKWYSLKIFRFDNEGAIATYAVELTRIIDDLQSKGNAVGVILTTIMLPKLWNRNYIVLPNKFDSVSVIYSIKLRRIVCPMNVGNVDVINPGRGANTVVWMLQRIKGGNYIVLVNKRILSQLLVMLPRIYGKDKVEVYGDVEKGVIDYVVLRRDNKTTILLAYVHGRLGFGVSLPNDIKKVDYIFLLAGVKRYIGGLLYIPLKLDIVKRKQVDWVLVKKLMRWGLEERGIRSGGEFGHTYALLRVVGKEIRLYVYDIWESLYDIHVALQIVGRAYLMPFKMLVLRWDYLAMVLSSYMFDITTSCYSNMEDELYEFENIETGETIYPESPREILGESSLPIDMETYYETRRVEFERIEKKLRKMKGYFDLVLTAKYISYKLFVEKKLNEAIEFVKQLPSEIRIRLNMWFKFMLWLD